MIPFDYLETLKAIRLCVQKPRYKVGVFTRTMKDAKYVCSEIIDAIREDEEESRSVDRFLNTSNDGYIVFKNGSVIRVVRASENARGCKFNHVLYRKDIEHDILHTVVRTTEFRYKE